MPISSVDINLLQAGEILKSNGTEGEVLISLSRIGLEDFDTNEPVFINFDGLPVPFFVETFTPRGTSRAIVKFTTCNSLEDAEELRGKAVLVDAGAYGDEDYEDDLGALEGWKLLSADGDFTGTISGYEDIPGNPCLYVATPEGEAMIPFHEELIVEVDEASRTLTMDIPKGLI